MSKSSKSSVSDIPQANALVKGLSILLADTYLLKLKTHGYHWNVEGKDFFGLHQVFMAQYTEMELAIDAVAERIRALGFYAPASYKEYIALTNIEEIQKPKDAIAMAKDLAHAHKTLLKRAKQLSADSAKSGDAATQALVDDRITVHEKTLWMLKSFIG